MLRTKENNTNGKNTKIFIKSYGIVQGTKKYIGINKNQSLEKEDCCNCRSEKDQWFQIQLYTYNKVTNNAYIIQEIRHQHNSNDKLMKALNNKKLDIYIYIELFTDNVFCCIKNNKQRVVIKEEDINNVSHVKELLLSVVLNRGYQYISSRVENEITNSNTKKNNLKEDNENNLISILGSIPPIRIEKRILCKAKTHTKNIKYIIGIAGEILNRHKNQKKSEVMSHKNHKQEKKPDNIIDINFDKGKIPDFIESFMFDNKIFFITSYSGIDLYEYIAKHLVSNKVICIKETICKCIFSQIFRILDDLHNLGIAHGDMSLENTCLDITNCKHECMHNHRIPRVRLIDFGFSIIHPLSPLFEMLEGRQQCRRIVMHNEFNKTIDNLKCSVSNADYFHGKIDYISPERLKAHYVSNYTYDAYKDDIYAVGIMLFRTLFAISPYDNIKEYDVLERIIFQEHWLFSNPDIYNLITKNISNDCLNLIRRILKPESERITLKEIFKHNWLMTLK